MTNTIEYLY